MANGDVLAELWPGSVYQCRINEVIFSGSILVLVFFFCFSHTYLVDVTVSGYLVTNSERNTINLII